MEEVELHGAFVWDCNSCGRENFERAMEGDLPEEFIEAMEEDGAIVQVYAPDAEFVESTVDGDQYETVRLCTRLMMVPKRVQCAHCKAVFETTIPEDDLEDDE